MGEDASLSLAELLQSAVSAHEQGDLESARAAYDAVLERSPEQPDALHLLGVIADQQGRHGDAVELIGRAIARTPQVGAFHNNLGNALLSLGRTDDAAAAYRRALAIDPKDADGHVNLGNLLRRQGDDAAALVHYRDALKVMPQNATAHLGAGSLLLGQLQPAAALPHLIAAVRIDPVSAVARDALATALRQLARYPEAVFQHRKAMALAPLDLRYRENLANTLISIDSPKAYAQGAKEYLAILERSPERVEALIGLGALHVRLHEPLEALAVLERARRIAPARFEVQVNYIAALSMAGRLEEALSLCDQLVASFPDDCIALSHRGTAREHAGDYTGALADYGLALQASNNRKQAVLAETEFKRALLLMSLGRLAEGWPLYQARLNLRAADPRAEALSKRLPAWDGVVRAGQRIVVWGEQGIGDQILYGSMLPDLVDTGAEVIFACDPRLVPLFSRSVDRLRVVAVGLPVVESEIDSLAADADAQIGLCDLGALLRPDMASVPEPQAYLKPDPAAVAALRQRYAAYGKRHVIGITWRSANRKLGSLKSASLLDWAPVLKRRDVLFVDMQYGDTSEELHQAKSHLGVDILHDASVDAMLDLDRYAAQAGALDMLLGCSNSGVHIAAATGRPCWVMVPSGLGRLWYWHLEREDSPWYPHVRLFRQRAGMTADWSGTIAEIAAALQREFGDDGP